TAPTLVISPNTKILTRGDTLRFAITSGGTPPYNWTSGNTSIATINASSGLLTAVGRGATTISVVDSFGFTATSGSISVNDVRATLPDTSVGLGNTIDLPLSVEDLSGLGIYSYETRIAYDSTIVKFAGILTTGTMSSAFTVTYKDTLDTLRVAAAGSAALVGSGTLLKLQFTPAPGAVIGNFSALNFTRFRFNETSATTPTATTINGRLSIGNLPPGAPTATAATGTSQTGFTANWNAVTGATSYRLDVSSDNFTTFVTGYSNLTVAGTSQSVTGLAAGTTYSYRVRAVNTGGTSANSNAISVTTTPSAPSTPVAAAASNITATGFTANWNAAASATSYQLDVSSDNFITFVSGFNSFGVSGTSQNVTGLLPGTAYSYMVRAVNAGGTSGNSNVISVTTTVLPPGAPILNSPADSAKGVPTTITLSWDSTAGATTYHLQVATDSAFTKIVADQVSLTVRSFSVTGLLNGTNYFWHVSASNAGGAGPFSVARIFTTVVAPPIAPVLISPSDSAKGVPTTLVLTWSKPAGATTFRLQVAMDAAFSALAFDDSTIVDTTKQVGPFGNDSTYFWRVRAKNTGGTSAFSVIRSFKTIAGLPAVPTLFAPNDGATGVAISPTLQWMRSALATSYRVQVSQNSSFTIMVFEDSTVADTARQVGPLATSTTYFWRVSAKNSGGASAFSTSRNFTTIFGEPTLIAPPNGAANITLTPTLSWTASSGATSYHVQLSTVSSFASIVTEDSAVAGTSKTVGPLASGTTYFWRVRARNAGATSAFSSVGSFTTITPPAVPTLLSPTEGATNQPTTLTLIWRPSFNASTYHLQISTASDFSSTVTDQSALADTSFTIVGLQKSTLHFWRVRASNAAGASSFSPTRQFTTGIATSVELTENGIPTTFYLSQNYPNPFNPSTKFEIHIANLGMVTLKIYNVLGNEIATLMNGDFVPGIYRVTWKADNLPSGMYFYRLNVLSKSNERWTATKKLLLIK
ncbi:MAG: fibronectin type III domain-containing protein, partial [Ignavibacteriales bacterium]|nr:fibronectin type III domain-containing protein [Ignavibacteriales bacterium]